MTLRKLAIVQPEVPHYREEFFAGIRERCEKADVYVYNSQKVAVGNGFKVQSAGVGYISNLQWHGVLWYNPFKLVRKEYDTLVLMLHFAHITTWLLLLTKFIHRKRIILYGQGISVKRYLKEEQKVDWKLKRMIALADGVWLYMPKEEQQWKEIFPQKTIVALNNTVTGMKEIVSYIPAMTKIELKEKYAIKEERILIFCARFTSPYRRVDLLLQTIEKLDRERFGFIIIGDGVNKPDFTKYTNVHDFGAVYDVEMKRELFAIADIYYQPGWVGLSIVEAMGYGLPVFTFIRSVETLQCVEYSYIEDGMNGTIFETVDECVEVINESEDEEIAEMGEKAKALAKTLLAENMVNRAMSILE